MGIHDANAGCAVCVASLNVTVGYFAWCGVGLNPSLLLPKFRTDFDAETLQSFLAISENLQGCLPVSKGF